LSDCLSIELEEVLVGRLHEAAATGPFVVTLGASIGRDDLDVGDSSHEVDYFFLVLCHHEERKVSFGIQATGLAGREEVTLSRVFYNSCL